MKLTASLVARLGLAAVLLAATAILAAPVAAPVAPVPSPAPAFTHQDLARESVIIDLHSDAFDKILKRGRNVALFGGTSLQTGLPCLRRGGIKAQFFAIWDRPRPGVSFAEILLKLFNEMLAKYPNDMAFAGSADDIERNLAAGKISALLAIEGGEAIGGDLNKLDYFYGRGVRYMTLTWNHTNLIADAAKDPKKPHHGLSAFGEKVVARMNRLGMIIDVSHTSNETVRDVLALSRAPIIASHSNAAAVRPHPRNLSDALILELCQCDGVIGVNYHRPFVSGRPGAGVREVADHIDHIVKVGGIDCVALGSDYDGDIIPVAGLQNAGQLENLTRELIRRGYSRAAIEKIYGQNVLRVMRATIKKVASSR